MTAEINQGIRILLERMKSNPEEFEVDRVRSTEGIYRFRNNKWNFIHEYIREDSWVTAEERKLLLNGISKVQADAFTRNVMATLLKDEELEPYISSEAVFNTHKFNSSAINANMLVGNQQLSLRHLLDDNNSNSGNYHESKK